MRRDDGVETLAKRNVHDWPFRAMGLIPNIPREIADPQEALVVVSL